MVVSSSSFQDTFSSSAPFSPAVAKHRQHCPNARPSKQASQPHGSPPLSPVVNVVAVHPDTHSFVPNHLRQGSPPQKLHTFNLFQPMPYYYIEHAITFYGRHYCDSGRLCSCTDALTLLQNYIRSWQQLCKWLFVQTLKSCMLSIY